MLLGYWYDESDHTYNGREAGVRILIDADTLEVIAEGQAYFTDIVKHHYATVNRARDAGYVFLKDD